MGTPDGLNYIDARIIRCGGLPPPMGFRTTTSARWSGIAMDRCGLERGRDWLMCSRFGEHLSIRTLTTKDGLGGDLIGALMFKSGELWAATSGGLSVVRSDGTIRTSRAKDGLGATIATAMAEDRAGHLWVAGNNGSLSYHERRKVSAGRSGLRRQGDATEISRGSQADRLGFFWFRMDRGIRRVAVNALTAMRWKGLAVRCRTVRWCSMVLRMACRMMRWWRGSRRQAG